MSIYYSRTLWRFTISPFVVFNAAGKWTVYEAIKLLEGFKWGVAGRNEEKLKATLKEMGDKAHEDLSATPIIVADVNDESSLAKMARRANVRSY